MSDEVVLWPNLFLVGAQKSGTTSFYDLLTRHPEVNGAHCKEPNILGCREEASRSAAYTKRWHGSSSVYRLDGSQVYLANPLSLKRIADVGDKTTRVLVLLRNPVERAISAYWYARALGLESRGIDEAFSFVFKAKDSSDALRIEAGQVDADFAAGAIKKHAYSRRFQDELWQFKYFYNSCYGHQLRSCYEVLPREAVAIFFTEELREDQEKVLNTCFKFLGLDPGEALRTETLRENKTRLQREGALPTLSRWAKRGVPQWLRRELRPLFGRYYDAATLEAPPPVSPVLREKMFALMSSDIADLARISGLRLPAGWKSW